MKKLEKFVNNVSRYLNWLAGVGLIAMAILVVADIIGNKVFKFPLPGGIEYVAFFGVIVTAFAIAQTQLFHGHIEVEFIANYFSRKTQRILAIFVYVCSLVLWLVILWTSIEFANTLLRTGEVSMTERIHFYPFVYAMAFCCIPVLLVLSVQLIKEISGTKKR